MNKDNVMFIGVNTSYLLNKKGKKKATVLKTYFYDVYEDEIKKEVLVLKNEKEFLQIDGMIKRNVNFENFSNIILIFDDYVKDEFFISEFKDKENVVVVSETNFNYVSLNYDFSSAKAENIVYSIKEGYANFVDVDQTFVLKSIENGFSLKTPEQTLAYSFDREGDKETFLRILQVALITNKKFVSDEYFSLIKKYQEVFDNCLLENVLVLDGENKEKIVCALEEVKKQRFLFDLKSEAKDGVECFNYVKTVRDIRYDKVVKKVNDNVNIMDPDANEFLLRLKQMLNATIELNEDTIACLKYFKCKEFNLDAVYDASAKAVEKEYQNLMFAKKKDNSENVGAGNADLRQYEGSENNEGCQIVNNITTYSNFLKMVFPQDKLLIQETKERLISLIVDFLREMSEVTKDNDEFIKLTDELNELNKKLNREKEKVVLVNYLKLDDEQKKVYLDLVIDPKEKKTIDEYEKIVKEIQDKENQIKELKL